MSLILRLLDGRVTLKRRLKTDNSAADLERGDTMIVPI
jgi:hypothetical protein